MHIWQALILGAVEGLTEFLPISANGHLLMVGRWMGVDPALLKNFGIILQGAPLLAVLVLYRQRLKGLLGVKGGGADGLSGRKGWELLALSSLPVLAVGFLFEKKIKALLFGPLPFSLALGLGGIAILWVESRRRPATTPSLDRMTNLQALGIGLFQMLALCPGVSRSGATIVAGLLLGLSREDSALFSFFTAIPVLAAAVGYEALKSRDLWAQAPAVLAGFLLAFACALVSIKALMAMLSRLSFKPFGWYRILAAPFFWFFSR